MARRSWRHCKPSARGPDAVVEAILDALRPHFDEPIEVWTPGSGLVLSSDGGTRTLILRDVAAMPRDDQHKLCDWLEITAGRTRVVTTTRQPLFPLLEASTFVATLYYRLKCSLFPGDRMRHLTVLGATR